MTSKEIDGVIGRSVTIRNMADPHNIGLTRYNGMTGKITGVGCIYPLHFNVALDGTNDVIWATRFSCGV